MPAPLDFDVMVNLSAHPEVLEELRTIVGLDVQENDLLCLDMKRGTAYALRSMMPVDDHPQEDTITLDIHFPGGNVLHSLPPDTLERIEKHADKLKKAYSEAFTNSMMYGTSAVAYADLLPNKGGPDDGR